MRYLRLAILTTLVAVFVAASPRVTHATCYFRYAIYAEPSCGSGLLSCTAYICDSGASGGSCGCLTQTKNENLDPRAKETLIASIILRRDQTFNGSV
jgi:hypothetical protein